MTSTENPPAPAQDPQDPVEASSEALPADPARAARQRAVADARRELVMTAARDAFIELGIEGASLREIARRAGYSPAAIYRYFDSKEAVYGALLGESLERLNAHVAAAQPAGPVPAEELRARAGAFFAFYREHPRDLDLGFYLFQGLQPRGLTPDLNTRLNARLRDALQPAQDALVALGLSPIAARAEVTALFAQIVGLLLLSHTGRIRMFGITATTLFQRHLDQLIERAGVSARPRSPAP